MLGGYQCIGDRNNPLQIWINRYNDWSRALFMKHTSLRTIGCVCHCHSLSIRRGDIQRRCHEIVRALTLHLSCFKSQLSSPSSVGGWPTNTRSNTGPCHYGQMTSCLTVKHWLMIHCPGRFNERDISMSDILLNRRCFPVLNWWGCSYKSGWAVRNWPISQPADGACAG